MLQPPPPFLDGGGSHQSWGTGQEGPADDSGGSVRLCVVVLLLPLDQPLLGTGKCCLPGRCPFTAQLLSSGVFLATSSEASQPSACPLIFAAVIHPWLFSPVAVLWEGPCTLCPCRGRMPAPILTLPCPSAPPAASASHRGPGPEALQRGPCGHG